MEITVKVSDRDINRIIQIGCKKWQNTTPEEREEYNRLVSYYGTAVLIKILPRQN